MALANMKFTENDYRYMSRAIQLAKKGLYSTSPNPRVGCVIVKDNQIIGEGWHEHAGEAHAEINALKQAGENAKGASVYVTLEPCSHFGRTPPCSSALINAGVSQVIAAMQDPNPQVAGSGMKQLNDAGINTASGLLQTQAEDLNPGFIKRMTQQRPFVRCKLAMSLDARTAMASGESKWITGSDARQDVQRLRAQSCAIVTGIGTIIHDDPSMTVRANQIGLPTPVNGWRQPLKIVLDSHLRCPLDAKILQDPASIRLITSENSPANRSETVEKLTAKGVSVIGLPVTGRGINLSLLLSYLAETGINEVLIESGSSLAGAFIEQGLIDDLVVYVAASIMGDSAKGLLHLPGIEHMSDKIQMDFTDIRKVGKDLRITARL